ICGCTSNGQYYKPDQTIWGNDQCTKKCRCNPLTKKLDCVRAKCKASETCKVLKGVRGCHPVSYATCRASGDPHYKTFDGKTYDFMGTCVYRFSARISACGSRTIGAVVSPSLCQHVQRPGVWAVRRL
uniref:IgGFc-binding protein-like n=1 Tax=Callorhinchus milii TaxID=7868 RepID=A0A4W3HCU0_CALMI